MRVTSPSTLGAACLGLVAALGVALGLPVQVACADAVFQTPPAPYVHPRVLFNPDELADIKDRLDNTTIGTLLRTSNFPNWINQSQGDLVREIGALDLSGGPTLAQVQQYVVSGEGRNIAFFLMALDGVLYSNAVNKADAIDGVVNYAKLINASNVLEPGRGIWASSNWDLGVQWTLGGAGFALAYDILYHDMTANQQAEVRLALSLATTGRRSWGMDFPPHRAYGNWWPYHGHLPVMLLAIEGETGYDAEVFDLWVDVLQDWFDHAVYPSGAGMEDSYTFLGLREGSTAMAALAKRGHNFFAHPNYQALTRWVCQSLEPDSSGDYIGHASGGGVNYPTFWYVMKYAYPDDPVVDYNWHYFTGDDYTETHGGHPHGPLRWQSYVEAAVFCRDWDHPLDWDSLGLEKSAFYPRRGLMVARSDATEDATYLHFDARPDAMFPGHDNADRGGFTLSALGRQWVPDRAWGTFKESADHSLVRIDGQGEAYKAPSVNFLSFSDEVYAVTGAADLEYAYDYQWSPPWPNSGTTYSPPWEHEISDPADLGWPGDEAWFPTTLYGLPDFGFIGMYMWRAPHIGVEKCFRTAKLVRGEAPYVLLVDDVKKDTSSHLYEWYLQLETDISIESQSSSNVVLAEDSGSRRLLVRVLDSGGPVSVSIESYTKDGEDAKRLILACTAVSAEYKIMLWPHLDGDALPASSWNPGHDQLTIDVGGRSHVFGLSMDPDGRSLLVMEPPWPSVSNGPGATGITTSNAVLNGYFEATGTSPAKAFICWGTSNQGTNAAAWDVAVPVATEVGPFSIVVPIVPDQQYYYRCYATNATEIAWADHAEVFGIPSVGSVPFLETFEPDDALMAGIPGPVHAQHGWSSAPTPGAVVQNITPYRSVQAGTVEAADMTQDFTDGQTNVWIELFAQPVRGGDTDVPPEGATTFFWVNTAGHVMAHSNSVIVESTGVVVPSNSWSRFVVNCDYGTKTWSLWHDGNPVFSGFGFMDPAATVFARFGVRDGDAAASGSVDDISIDLVPPSLVPGDGDGDFMPDSWELQYVGDTALLGHGPGWDHEPDGFIDYHEYLAGTIPTSADSRLAFEDVEKAPEGAVMTWQSVSNRAYIIRWAPDPTGTWSNLATGILATPPSNVYTNDVGTIDQGVYGIKLDLGGAR